MSERMKTAGEPLGQDVVSEDVESAVGEVAANQGVAAAGNAEAAAAGVDEAPEGEAADEPTEEELAAARELAENNALADVFDDVRKQSADSHLVTPERWPEIGLVPEAADKAPEAVEDSAEAESAAGVDASVQVDNAAESAESAAVAATPAASEPAPGSPDSAAEDEQPAEDDRSPFAGLRIPEGYRLEQIEGEWVLVEDENAAPVRKEIKCNRIKVLMGMHSYYLYDETLMTASYARWAFLAAEDNPVVTFVECVREDSRVYPRPYAAECLKNPPFRMTDEQIEETWQAVRDSGNYPDIERTEASNGDVYYYSTQYLESGYAASLAEYDAVERPADV